jgi:ATP-dependent DNA helicase RecQ
MAFSPVSRGGVNHWLETDQAEKPVLVASPLEAELDLERASEVLNTVFGFDSFWPHQEEIITNLLQRKDTVAIMPTGSGKSLCYQLPALLSPGLTVVVSPLIALMQDQVDQLRFLEVPAVYLNSTLTYSEYLQNVSKIKRGEIDLLYIAPETLLKPETMLLLEQCYVNYLTVDEAHCISSWGHDFRPEYRRLIDVRKRLPEATCFALTATATARVREDIKKQLGMPGVNPIVASFDRKNLFLEVRPKSDGWRQLLTFLEAHRNQAGIIYCATRRQVDSLAADLAAEDWTVVPYHAGLEREERLQNQRLFAHDKVEIVVATIAFGMGIDKPNVRFVVHYDTPKNLESYYQQIGRAGRDGFDADCLFLFSWGDISTIKYFINESPANLQKGEYQRLDKLIEFAEGHQCRRKVLLAYFGECYHNDNCQACDICLSSKDVGDLVDATEEARKFISCVKETGQIFGSTHIISILRGSRSKKVMKFRHNRLPSYDCGREHSTKEWQELARQFFKQELLVRDSSHGSLKLTPRSYSVLKGEKIQISKIEVEERRPRRDERIEYDADLYDQLRNRNIQLADKAGVPAFFIFPERSLQEMAMYYPQTRESFSKVYGVGRAKLENFAGEFLPIIKAYCEVKGIAEVPRRKRRSRKSRKSRRRSDEAAAEYNKGVPVVEITRSMNIKTSTLLRYLWHSAQKGEIDSIDRLWNLSQLGEDEKSEIWHCFDRLGVEFLRPVYEELNETFSYDDLRLVQICYLVSMQQEASK